MKQKVAQCEVSSKIGFLCIGAQKCGTTWLNEQLLSHPDVYLPPIKESHYFNYVHSEPDRGWIIKHYQRPAKNRIKKLIESSGEIDWERINYYSRLLTAFRSGQIDDAWYQDIFSPCQDERVLKGDITPAYLPMPMAGILAVQKYNPSIKLIALLREPVSRALSAARMMLKWKKIDDLTDDHWLSIMSGNGIINKSRYAPQLEKWLRVFPKNQISVIPYERIAVEPKAVMDDICNFLSISEVKDDNLLNQRVHRGKDYNVPSWVREKLEPRLAPERQASIELFPELAQWWT